MITFEFSTSSRIVFGVGKLNSIAELAIPFGKRALIVSGTSAQISSRAIETLEAQGIECTFYKISHEPTIELITGLLDRCKPQPPDVLIGIGGGSAMDTAKAVAALLQNPGEVTDYLEVIGASLALRNPSLPVIAIPTTAGTGAEVTRNAVLDSPADHVKVSLRSPYLFPKIALVDPELILSLSPSMTAQTGLDALTQLIEPYTCLLPNPLVDSLCLEGITRIGRSFYQAYDFGGDISARQDMALSSLFSGICLTNAKLGAVHGLAGVLGGELHAPHGAICGRLLPFVMQTNLNALYAQAPGSPVIERYEIIARLLTGRTDATPVEGIEWIKGFCSHAQIPPLSTYGLSPSMFDKIIPKSMNANSMKGNPLTLSEKELRTILEHSL